MMSQNLLSKLRGYIEFDEEEEQFISRVFKAKVLAKGEHLLLAGSVCREAAFIESGVFRSYINTDQRDATFYFAAENDFICDYSSFLPKGRRIRTFRRSNRLRSALSVLMAYKNSTEMLFSVSVSAG